MPEILMLTARDFGQAPDVRRMVANPLADFRRWFPV
jgi:hypothetical protein